jgi:hypothetical protein
MTSASLAAIMQRPLLVEASAGLGRALSAAFVQPLSTKSGTYSAENGGWLGSSLAPSATAEGLLPLRSKPSSSRPLS